MRDSFWETTTPRALHRQQSETPPVLRKGSFCLSTSCGLQGRLLVWNTSEGPRRCTQRTEVSGHNLCSPSVALLYLPAVFQKGALVWDPGFTVAARGPLVSCWAYACGSIKTNQWRTLKQLPPSGYSRRKQT